MTLDHSGQRNSPQERRTRVAQVVNNNDGWWEKAKSGLNNGWTALVWVLVAAGLVVLILWVNHSQTSKPPAVAGASAPSTTVPVSAVLPTTTSASGWYFSGRNERTGLWNSYPTSFSSTEDRWTETHTIPRTGWPKGRTVVTTWSADGSGSASWQDQPDQKFWTVQASKVDDAWKVAMTYLPDDRRYTGVISRNTAKNYLDGILAEGNEVIEYTKKD